MTYGNIGNTLIAEGQLQKGNDYLQKALILRGYPDEQRFRLFIYLDVYGVYMKQNKITLAKVQLDSAVALSLKINNIVATSIVANNEGFYYQTINDTKNALKAYMKSYLLSDSTGNDYQKSEVSVNIGYLYLQQKKYPQAEKFAQEAMVLGKKFKNLKVVADAYDILKNVETNTGNLSRALHYAELNKVYADSATNSETQKLILSLESRYQHQKKESEIANLTNLATQRELEVVKRNRLLVGGGIFSCAALLILGLLYKNSRQRQLLAEHKQSLQRERIKFLEGQQQVATLQGILKGQDEERGRLAKDLHDGLGGLLSGVKFSLTNMKSNVVLDAESALVFERSLDMLDNSISELRRVAHNMMPEVLVKFGLQEALKSYCDSIQQSGIFKVEFQSLGNEIRVASNTEIILYRIVQELLNNASKYAKASTVLVQLAFHENEINITVEDNGVGFDVSKTQQSTGAGWNNIRSRVEYLRGTVDVTSGSKGTSVHLHIPV
jgi:signal transduction histidine kinase